MPPLNPGERAALVAAAIRTYGITDQQAQHDVDVQSVAPSIVNKLQQALGAGYAGVWFDMHAGKFKIDVAPSTNIASVARVENYFGIAGADSEQVPVSYTWNQLSAVQAKWQPRVRALPASDEATVGINAPDNAVVVSASENAPAADINPLAATAVSENATIGGPPVKVVRSELAPTTLTSCSYSPRPRIPLPYRRVLRRPAPRGNRDGQRQPPELPDLHSWLPHLQPEPQWLGRRIRNDDRRTLHHDRGTGTWFTYQANHSTFQWIGGPAVWFFDQQRGDAALINITGPYFCYSFGGSCAAGQAAGYNVEFAEAHVRRPERRLLPLPVLGGLPDLRLRV
ncbi:MAG: hypothetical protein M3071_14120 [Actinomycetota bacterium]|nr:hypothetical protein [Actinomycetota bacterium]